VLRPGAPALIRNAFPGRHHGIGLFRYWPEAIAALDTFPGITSARAAFAAASFSYVTMESVRPVMNRPGRWSAGLVAGVVWWRVGSGGWLM
jgi:hypothetical protein